MAAFYCIRVFFLVDLFYRGCPLTEFSSFLWNKHLDLLWSTIVYTIKNWEKEVQLFIPWKTGELKFLAGDGVYAFKGSPNAYPMDTFSTSDFPGGSPDPRPPPLCIHPLCCCDHKKHLFCVCLCCLLCVFLFYQ